MIALRSLLWTAGLVTLTMLDAAHATCPRSFDRLTTGLPTACLFAGFLNGSTGSAEGPVLAAFAGDGTVIVVSVAMDSGRLLYFPARVLSATSAELVRWQTDLDLSSAERRGTVRLEQDGEQLAVRFEPPDGGGEPLTLHATFVGMAAPGADASARGVQTAAGGP